MLTVFTESVIYKFTVYNVWKLILYKLTMYNVWAFLILECFYFQTSVSLSFHIIFVKFCGMQCYCGVSLLNKFLFVPSNFFICSSFTECCISCNALNDAVCNIS